jgi:hypothetical protein
VGVSVQDDAHPPQPWRTLSSNEQAAFDLGYAVFNTLWVPANTPAGRIDGLGPLFNSPGCDTCHNSRRRGRGPRIREALSAIDKPREEDAKFLDVGLRVFPGEDELRVGTAVVDYHLEHREAAMATLDRVLRPESTLDAAQRSYAAALRRTWLLDAMRSEIDIAVSKSDFAGAREVVSRYRERVGKDAADANSYLEQLDSGLVVQELVARYQTAVQARKKAEARALAEQLLARPDLPANLRTYFQQRLQDR